MNAERLHVVARAIQQELSDTRLIENFKELTAALQSYANQPINAAYQQTVANKRNEISAALRKAASNQFSPAWRQILTEIGGEDLIGDRLEERMRSIFERNQITPSNALQELRSIE